MSSMSRALLILAACLSLVALLVRSQSYSLAPTSAYITNCVAPCKCAMVAYDLSGTFTLAKGKAPGVQHLENVRFSSSKAAKSWAGQGWIWSKVTGLQMKITLTDEKKVTQAFNGTESRSRLPIINSRITGVTNNCNQQTYLIVATPK